jgi:hypothetical protein
MNTQETIFADGLIVKKNENAPDFVICNLSVKVDEFEKFIKQHQKNGWVNLSCLVGRNKPDGTSGKPYAKLDTYEPKQEAQQTPPLSQEIEDNDGMPF